MSQQVPSQDSNFDEFKKVWEEMDQIEPLTPIPSKKGVEESLRAYREAAEHDDYLFGDYDYEMEWNQ